MLPDVPPRDAAERTAGLPAARPSAHVAARSALPHRLARRTLPALLAAGLAVTAAAAPAGAEPPVDLTGQVVDLAGVLGDGTGDVEAAQRDLVDAAGVQLYAVFVDTFDGADGLQWAVDSAERSGIGTDDVVLAVAVEDRQYGLAVPNALGLSDATQSSIRRTALEPELSAEDWPGAVVATAEALGSALAGDTGTGGAVTPGATSTGSSGGGLLTFLLLGAVAVGGFLLLRSFRRKQQPGRGAAQNHGQGHGQGAGGPDGPAPVDTATLDSRASTALVRLDDTLRASEQELGFAQAQFGMEETRRFTEVLDAAKEDALAAFTLRQRLDDDIPETEDERRAMLTQILQLCGRAGAAIEEQTTAFDDLRDLQARAPEVLSRTGQRADEVEARVPAATRTLETLARTYPASALASVARNPEQATALLAAARESVAQGRTAVDADDRAAAVAAARIAENAVAQAVPLLDAVDRAGQELAGRRRPRSPRASRRWARTSTTRPASPRATPPCSPPPCTPAPSRDAARPPVTAATRCGACATCARPRPSWTPRSSRPAARPSRPTRAPAAARRDRAGDLAGARRHGLHRHAPRRGRSRGTHPARRGQRLPRRRPSGSRAPTRCRGSQSSSTPTCSPAPAQSMAQQDVQAWERHRCGGGPGGFGGHGRRRRRVRRQQRRQRSCSAASSSTACCAAGAAASAAGGFGGGWVGGGGGRLRRRRGRLRRAEAAASAAAVVTSDPAGPRPPDAPRHAGGRT